MKWLFTFCAVMSVYSIVDVSMGGEITFWDYVITESVLGLLFAGLALQAWFPLTDDQT